MLFTKYAVPSLGLSISTKIADVVRYESLLRTFISTEKSSSVVTESDMAVYQILIHWQ